MRVAGASLVWSLSFWALACGSTAEPGAGTQLPAGGTRSDAAQGGSQSAAVGGKPASAGAGAPAASASGGAVPRGGAGGTKTASAGAGGSVAAGSGGRSEASGGSGGAAAPGEHFSFFVTSLEAMRELSGSQDGFGGDLRYGEADGLTGADKICREIAESSLPGAGQKTRFEDIQKALEDRYIPRQRQILGAKYPERTLSAR